MGSSPDEPFYRENETPQHEVKISAFLLGAFPVTQEQWLAVMETLPKIPPEFRGARFSVVNVWLEKALEFCARASRIASRKIRLPSEAEWEYAARAGTKTPFYFGETLSTNDANFNGAQPSGHSSEKDHESRLTEVGSFPPNAFGLYDMHGNVWEWCADVWHENYENAPTDGSAWTDGGDRGYCVQRGGAWNTAANRCRSAFRVGDIAQADENIVGLRVCADKA